MDETGCYEILLGATVDRKTSAASKHYGIGAPGDFLKQLLTFTPRDSMEAKYLRSALGSVDAPEYTPVQEPPPADQTITIVKEEPEP
ncbi:MAG: hypothetical protein LBH66_09000 [Oscillospiraceae bacterium]|jgi:hypothetical protein|nr:hypothetical protein [Oscillospiraceae bacterium]